MKKLILICGLLTSGFSFGADWKYAAMGAMDDRAIYVVLGTMMLSQLLSDYSKKDFYEKVVKPLESIFRLMVAGRQWFMT